MNMEINIKDIITQLKFSVWVWENLMKFFQETIRHYSQNSTKQRNSFVIYNFKLIHEIS